MLAGEFDGETRELAYILSLLEALVSLEVYRIPPVEGGHLSQPFTMWRDMEALRRVLKQRNQEASDASLAAMNVMQAGGAHASVPPPPMPGNRK